jgi:uncharacterized membrane protein HdeD (DUF308 family)
MKPSNLIDLIFAGVGMAMGVAAIVLNLLDPAANASTAITLLGIAVFCIGILMLEQVQKNGSES